MEDEQPSCPPLMMRKEVASGASGWRYMVRMEEAVRQQPPKQGGGTILPVLFKSGWVSQVVTYTWGFSFNSRDDLTVNDSQRGTIIVE